MNEVWMSPHYRTRTFIIVGGLRTDSGRGRSICWPVQQCVVEQIEKEIREKAADAIILQERVSERFVEQTVQHPTVE